MLWATRLNVGLNPHQSSATTAPEAPGLWAISQGFGDASQDDLDLVTRASFLYDSLYAHLRRV